jgi:hypothetical protein
MCRIDFRDTYDNVLRWAQIFLYFPFFSPFLGFGSLHGERLIWRAACMGTGIESVS